MCHRSSQIKFRGPLRKPQRPFAFKNNFTAENRKEDAENRKVQITIICMQKQIVIKDF